MVTWKSCSGFMKIDQKDVMDNLAKNGHVDVVRWLHENKKEGCTTQAMEGCTTVAMDLAAQYGHLGVLRFLSQNWSEDCSNVRSTSCNGEWSF